MPVSVKSKLLLYADDSVVLVSHRDPRVISNILSQELVLQWVANRQQTHAPPRKHWGHTVWNKKESEEYRRLWSEIKDTAIESVSEVKYLGIKIDKTLSGEGTLDTIVKKYTGRINILYRQAGCLPKAVKRTLCQSLVQCYLDYAVSSWYAALTQKSKRKSQILQNKMVRFILDLAPRTHLTIDDMKELNLLRVSQSQTAKAQQCIQNFLQSGTCIPSGKLC